MVSLSVSVGVCGTLYITATRMIRHTDLFSTAMLPCSSSCSFFFVKLLCVSLNISYSSLRSVLVLPPRIVLRIRALQTEGMLLVIYSTLDSNLFPRLSVCWLLEYMFSLCVAIGVLWLSLTRYSP